MSQGKTLRQKDAHAVEKIMVHHYQNIVSWKHRDGSPKTRVPLCLATLALRFILPLLNTAFWALMDKLQPSEHLSRVCLPLPPSLASSGLRRRLLEKVQGGQKQPVMGRALALRSSFWMQGQRGAMSREAEGGQRREGQAYPTRTPVSRGLQAHRGHTEEVAFALQSRC